MSFSGLLRHEINLRKDKNKVSLLFLPNSFFTLLFGFSLKIVSASPGTRRVQIRCTSLQTFRTLADGPAYLKLGVNMEQ